MTAMTALGSSAAIRYCFMRFPTENHVLVEVDDGLTSQPVLARETCSTVQDYFMLPVLLIERGTGRVFGSKVAVEFAQTAIDPGALRWLDGKIEF